MALVASPELAEVQLTTRHSWLSRGWSAFAPGTRPNGALVSPERTTAATAIDAIELPLNLHAVVMFKLRHEESIIVAIGWALAGLSVAVLQVLSLVGLLMSAIQPTCIYQARRAALLPRALRNSLRLSCDVRRKTASWDMPA